MSKTQRVFDVIGASAGLAVFAPAMMVIAAAVLIDDGRPVFFRQERVGYQRRPFQLLKFRSMRAGRVTGAGRLLRATGLDELPQFVNILRGELSAVGPRPVTAADADRYGWSDPGADDRWRVNPGLTGLAQLAARTPQEALAVDLVYARGPRLALDCRVVAMSFVVNVLGKARARRLFFGNVTAR